MTISINDAGTWRTITGVYVNDAGTWRAIQEVHVNDSGTWRQVFVNDAVSINVQSPFSSTTGFTATAQYQLASDGNVYITNGDNSLAIAEAWLTPATNVANYEARVTVNSGALNSGTVGAWLNLGSTRAWTVTRSINGSQGCGFTVEIRRASDAVVLDSAVITMTASFTP